MSTNRNFNRNFNRKEKINMKRLKKSKNQVICGVCGGIAEYLRLDPTIVRLIFIIAVILGFGTGVLLYILAALIMPSSSFDDDMNDMRNAHMENNFSGNTSGEGHSDKDFNSYFDK